MDRLDKIYRDIEEEGIKVKEFATKEIIGLAVEYKNKQQIIINKDKIKNRTHEHTLLAHEFCHLKTGTLYSLEEDQIKRDKNEYKNFKYMIQKYVPIQQLKGLIKKGYHIYEIAEELDLTEDVIVNAVKVYKVMNML